MSDFENGCSGDCSGCGSDCGIDGKATVTLTLDDGAILVCEILTIFPAGENQYIALLPLNENGKYENDEVFLYRYHDDEENPSLSNIEDDDEYEMVADAFDELLDNMEFDDMEDPID